MKRVGSAFLVTATEDGVMRNLIFFSFVALFLVSMSGLAFALEPERGVPAKPATPAQTTKPPTKISPNLTEQECGNLGGTVHSTQATICNSGKVCNTHDQNNVPHAVCISEATR